MMIKTASELREVGVRILDAAGSPHEESEWVVETMVRSNLMGYDSHGIMRIPFYVDRIEKGELKPGAPFEVERETPAMAVVNGHQGWGQVIAHKAMGLAIEKARKTAIGAVAVNNCQHSGRAGEWVSMAANESMIGMAFVNSRGGVGPVAPWGGIDRRLKPNPIAFAAPCGDESPVLVDFTTSVIAGGKISLALEEGRQLPEGCMIDAQGNPSTDPALFYGPSAGAMLHFGGPVGHKGYALNIMIDLMAGALTGSGCSGQNSITGNGIFFQAINVAHFIPVEEFISTAKELKAWVKSSRTQPGTTEILFPGELEYRELRRRQEEGIPVHQNLWSKLLEMADKLGVVLPK